MRRLRILVVSTVTLTALATAATPAPGKGEEPRAEHRVFTRTTDEAVTVRASTGPIPDDWGVGTCDEPGCMPAPCQARGIGIVGFSTPAAVGEAYLEYHRRPTTPLALVGVGTFGTNVGRPFSWVAVRVGSETARVTARFEGGGRDSMRPVDGWAILSTPVRDEPGLDYGSSRGELVARDDAGGRLARLEFDARTSRWGPPEPCPSAGLPSTFPEPTGRAPADEDGARRAIEDAFAAAYGGGGVDAATAPIEDAAEIAEVARIASDRYPQYAGKIRAPIEEIRFVDADEAAVRFRLDVAEPDGTTNLTAGGVGRAVLRDGRWLVARQTFCALLATGGVYCPLPDAPAPGG